MQFLSGIFYALACFGVCFYLLDRVVGQSAFQNDRLHQRLGQLVPHLSNYSVEKKNRYSDLTVLNDFMKERTLIKSIERLLEMARWRISVGVFIMSMFLTAGVIYLLLGIAHIQPKYAAIISIISLIAIPWFVLNFKRKQYLSRFGTNFPKALQVVRGALSAGLGLPIAFERAAKDSPFPVSIEFGYVVKEMSLGSSLVEALTSLYKRVPTPDVRTFVVAIAVQQEAGGNLTELVRNLEETIQTKVLLRREMDAQTAQARLSGWILSVMPPLLFLALKVLNPSYCDVLFQTPDGQRLLMITIIMQLIGFAWIMKVVTIKISA